MGRHLLCTQALAGSIPVASTNMAVRDGAVMNRGEVADPH